MEGPHHKTKHHKELTNDNQRTVKRNEHTATPQKAPLSLRLIFKFEDIESKLKSFAESRGRIYDPKHPLSCLPPTAAKHALDLLGADLRAIARAHDFGYSTVAGWFNEQRNPSRPTVTDHIYPVLCEAYAANYKNWTPATSLTHERANDDEDMLLFDALAQGGPLNYQARKALARRILILLTEGVIITSKDADLEHQSARENFSRSSIRLAACMLQGEDLNAAARMIMSMAGARQHHAPLAPDSPLPSFTPEMLWADEIDLTSNASPIDCTRAASALMNTKAREMEEWVIHYKLESMTNDELFETAQLIRDIYTRRRTSTAATAG